jgi:UMF1 family MFS transporter
LWGNVFGDSMLVAVAEPGKLDITSAIGYFAGYLGGGIFLALGVAMTLKPQWFGLADAASAVRLLLVLAALWWALFSLPLIFFVPRPRRASAHVSLVASAREGFLQFRETFRHVRAYKPVFVFLAAYWVYIDGVNTVIQMAVDYGKSIGFGTADLIIAVLVVQFIGVPAALGAGRLGERIGPRKGIFIGLAVYVAVSVYAAFMTSAVQFYLVAAAVGLVQGGVQLLSRSYYARLVPRERAGEFFGFYNMLGEFAAIIGPLLVGTVSYLSGNPRVSILSVIVLFAAGAYLLTWVREPSASA